MNLPEGKLKSREGKIVDADTLMDDLEKLAKAEVLKRNQKIAEKEVQMRAKKICLGAIKFFMLKTDVVKDVLFDPAKAISFEGDSGPYVMYSFARAKSILRKATLPKKFDAALLMQEEEKSVLGKLSKFEETVEQAAKEFAPNKMCNYLLELCAAFNAFYQKVPVLAAESTETKNARLALVSATAIAIQNGLRLLNIEALEEM